MLKIVSVLAALAALMISARFWQKRFNPHPELARKAVHVIMGLGTLAFPWIFDSGWEVLTLAAFSVGGLLLLRFYKRCGVSEVLGSVERFSLGEIYFSISVAILFVMTSGQRLLYFIPLLILTLADAAGALIGVRYGQIRYRTRDGLKSAEGSAAFFLTAFFSTWLPLLLFSSIGHLQCLLIACTLGILVMLMEAIAWHGLDNLIIPLASFLLLQEYLSFSAADLVPRLITIMLIAGLMIYLQRHTLLGGGAALGGALVLYATWTVGGWWWLFPPAMLFIYYLSTCSPDKATKHQSHSTDAILSVAAAGICCLFVARSFALNQVMLLPFTTAFAAQLAMVRCSELKWQLRARSDAEIGLNGFMTATVLIMLPYLIWNSQRALQDAALALPALALSVILFVFWQMRPHGCHPEVSRWIRQALIGGLAALIPLLQRL